MCISFYMLWRNTSLRIPFHVPEHVQALTFSILQVRSSEEQRKNIALVRAAILTHRAK